MEIKPERLRILGGGWETGKRPYPLISEEFGED